MDTLTTPITVGTTVETTKQVEVVEYPQSSLKTWSSNVTRNVPTKKTTVKFYSNTVVDFENFLLNNKAKSFIWNYDGLIYWCESYTVEYTRLLNNVLGGNIAINLIRDTNY